jgi:hypothetical protein
MSMSPGAKQLLIYEKRKALSGFNLRIYEPQQNILIPINFVKTNVY